MEQAGLYLSSIEGLPPPVATESNSVATGPNSYQACATDWEPILAKIHSSMTFLLNHKDTPKFYFQSPKLHFEHPVATNSLQYLNVADPLQFAKALKDITKTCEQGILKLHVFKALPPDPFTIAIGILIGPPQEGTSVQGKITLISSPGDNPSDWDLLDSPPFPQTACLSGVIDHCQVSYRMYHWFAPKGVSEHLSTTFYTNMNTFCRKRIKVLKASL